ncbi:MAG: hypothetical protein Q9171_007596 [Xanthocarpia ochracea]
MHFSAPLVLASLFSLAHALPQLGEPAQALPGRLPVSYNQPTYRTYSHKSGGIAAEVKASQPFTIKAYNSVTRKGEAQLDAQVNQTQAVYIGPHGQLRFSLPGGELEEGSENATFTLQPNPIPPPPGIAAFVFSGVGKATGYLACPITEEGPWQVFAGLGGIKDSWVPGGDVSNCIGIDALATNYTSPVPAAYQYV